MPYNSISEIPKYVKKYSAKIQRQWMHVFNSVYKSTDKNEERAVKAANSILKKRFKSKNSMEKNTQDDYFVHLVDRFLDNLRG